MLILIISIITMIANIISCWIAVKAKNEAKSILVKIENNNQNNVNNRGVNAGVMATQISGGVHVGRK